MRKLVVSQFITLDGVMEAPEKWDVQYQDDAAVTDELLAGLMACDCVLLGRITYEFFAARWPSRTSAMTNRFNMVPKLVVSASLQKTGWNNSTIIHTNAIEEIKKMKQLPGKDILVLGSHQLVQAFIQNNLIDEYKLFVFPLLSGAGKRLFEEGITGQTLKLVSTKPFASGIVATGYACQPNLHL
jgi:dihydrofolate reductase